MNVTIRHIYCSSGWVRPMTREKADVVASIENHVLRYAESTETGVVQTISVTELNLDGSSKYEMALINNKGRGGDEVIGETAVKTDKKARNITIPVSFIREHDEVRPGQTVNVVFYQYTENNTQTVAISDERSIIDRAKVCKDSGVSDNCDSRLYSEKAANHLSSSPKVMKFRNTRTGEEALAETHANHTSRVNVVSFPMSARRKVSAQPDDLIEIVDVGGESEKNNQELIHEMYEMISELHEAYLQQTDE